jgi:hypothetical protein
VRLSGGGIIGGALLAAGLCWHGGASAQHMFRCGSVYQDRPCEQEDVQKRFSHASGKFSVEQVNADTDKDCADFATATIPYWKRLNGGEGYEAVKAEIDARPISRYEKSTMRDALIALKEFKGSAAEVRGELERLCMNYKQKKGIATERDVNRAAQAQSDRAAAAQYRAEQSRVRAMTAQEEREQQYEMARQRAAAKAAQAAERAKEQR